MDLTRFAMKLFICWHQFDYPVIINSFEKKIFKKEQNLTSCVIYIFNWIESTSAPFWKSSFEKNSS